MPEANQPHQSPLAAIINNERGGALHKNTFQAHKVAPNQSVKLN